MSASTRLQYFEISPKLGDKLDLEREIACLAGSSKFPPDEQGPATAEGERGATDFELQATLETIDRARGDVEALLSRNEMLEAYVAEVERKARSEVKDALEAVETWTTRALDAEDAVARLEGALAEF